MDNRETTYMIGLVLDAPFGEGCYMFWQLSLAQALEASPTGKAYRVGSPSGVWVVEQHADASCTLIYYPDAPPGAPPEPVERWSFPTLERLIQEMERIPAAHVIHTDWYPDDGDF